jgi:WD40 repeat protein
MPATARDNPPHHQRRLRLFLSHAASDRPVARDLYDRLRAEGAAPWLDEEDLLPGQHRQREIAKAVKAADVVLVCLSPAAVGQASNAQKEIRIALDVADEQPEGTIYVIPVKLSPCELPERLAHLHSVNLFEERGYARLVRALQARAGELGLSLEPEQQPAPHQTPHTAHTPDETGAEQPDEQPPPLPLNIHNDLFTLPPPALLTPRSTATLPALLQQGFARRLTWGNLRQVFPLSERHVLGIATGGAALWDLAAGQAVWEIDCMAQCAAFHPERGLLALGDRQHIHLWHAGHGELVCTLRGHRGRVTCLAFSPDAELLASGANDRTTRLWHLRSATLRATLRGHTDTVRSVAFSPDGATLATGASNGTARLWRVEDGQSQLVLSGRAAINQLVFSPDGEILASAANKTVRLWRTSSGTRLDMLRGHRGAVLSAAFAPGGRALASASADQTVRLWRAIDGTCTARLEGHRASVFAVGFAPDGLTLASASADQTIRGWQAAAGGSSYTLAYTLEYASSSVTSVAFSPCGKLLAAGLGNQAIRIWRVEDGALLHCLEGHTSTIKSLDFSPDGVLLASGSDDRSVQVWSVERGERLHVLAHPDWVRNVTFSPDGKSLAASSRDVWLWQAADGMLLHTFTRHPEHVTSVAFSPDGAHLASGTWNGTARLWNVASGKRLRTLRARDRSQHENGEQGEPGSKRMLLRVAFVPDGGVLAVVSNDKTIRLWRLEDGGVRTHRLTGYGGTLLHVAFAPGGTTLAAGASDGAARVWNLASGALVHTLAGHTGGVQGVAFAPDGRALASASEDGTLRLWHLADAPTPG